MKEFYLITFNHKWLDYTAIGAGFATSASDAINELRDEFPELYPLANASIASGSIAAFEAWTRHIPSLKATNSARTASRIPIAA